MYCYNGSSGFDTNGATKTKVILIRDCSSGKQKEQKQVLRGPNTLA